MALSAPLAVACPATTLTVIIRKRTKKRIYLTLCNRTPIEVDLGIKDFPALMDRLKPRHILYDNKYK